MSENAYEAKAVGSDEAWERVNFETMRADLAAQYADNTDTMIIEVDAGLVVTGLSGQSYRKVALYA